MTTKKELFQKMWIDINKRLPQDDDSQVLIGFDDTVLRITTGKMLCLQQRQMEDKAFGLKIGEDKAFWHTGYFAIKWMKIHH